ncbi:MAG: glycosyl transferase family 2 [Firmicutes bacterium HGW-Firmicutes-13]|nr:MAG: glycosyl transferase family 2 [Firmicutes bacterium HGW-Firmicutes-13]
MLFAVIPAKNEENRIGIILHQLINLGVNRIVVVLNGSTDNTLKEVKSKKFPGLDILYFKNSLGIDVPRAVGAKYAYQEGARFVLFVDGDLIGNIGHDLKSLINKSMVNNLDLNMTNCYPTLPQLTYLTKIIIHFRQLLNQETGLIEKIGISSPSHGPHLVSRRLLEKVPFKELAIPPVEMVMALKEGLKIDVGVEIPHNRLGSSIKNNHHSQMIVKTIAGDCLEALSIYQGKQRSRFYEGVEYIGYHKYRRWDLLANFLAEFNKK